MAKSAVFAALLILTSCTYGSVEKRPDGTFSASVTRVLTDTAVWADSTPEQFSFGYTSDAENAGLADMNRALIEALTKAVEVRP